MAKKTPTSLKQRIDDLANAMGGSEKPAYVDVRSQLFDFSAAAEELQNGASIREAEEKIARLEEANAALKAEIEAEREGFSAEKEYLKVKVLEAKYEIDGFREEEKKREKKERDIPPIQSQILGLLAGEQSGDALSVEQIAHETKMPADEIEVHLHKLWEAGLARSQHTRRTGWTWRRTLEGNTLILSLRLAGEGQQKRYKYAELADIEQQALLMISEGEMSEREIARLLDKNLRFVRHHLHSLRDAEMATDAEEHPGDAVSAYDSDSAGLEATDSPMWRILRDGERYLAERDIL